MRLREAVKMDFFDPIHTLKLRLPVIQSPMAGIVKAKMVVATCEAGLVGSLGAGMMEPGEIREQVSYIKSHTQRPFNLNLFVLRNSNSNDKLSYTDNQISWIRDYYHKKQVPFNIPDKFSPSFKDQFQTLVELRPNIASFTFGILTKEEVDLCHKNNILVLGTATTTQEAIMWEQVGADGVCIQGYEAGSHRAAFLDPDSPGVGLFSLLNSVKNHVKIPIVAAGGIMDGKTILAALICGATMVQMGTAFLGCAEAELARPYRRALEQAQFPEDTALTKAITGRWARGIKNEFMEVGRIHELETAPYPIQNALTQAIRKECCARDDEQAMSLWAGQGVGHITKEIYTIQQLVSRLEDEIIRYK